MEKNELRKKAWPELNFEDWKETLYTVQLWTQIVGKIRLVKMPWVNHSWHVTLYVSPRGLTTGSIPYEDGLFQIDFDFNQHELTIISTTGGDEKMDLYARTVADFYQELFSKLKAMNITATIHAVPNEIEPAIPFEQDEQHKAYEKEKIKTFWEVLIKYTTSLLTLGQAFGAKAALYTFSGALLTWRLPVFPAGLPPNTPAVRPTYRSGLCRKLILTR